jgi:hypothetical protein
MTSNRANCVKDIEAALATFVAKDDTILDGAVHDQASETASSVNNGGVAAQIEYLLDNGWDKAAILRYVQDNAG